MVQKTIGFQFLKQKDTLSKKYNEKEKHAKNQNRVHSTNPGMHGTNPLNKPQIWYPRTDTKTN